MRWEEKKLGLYQRPLGAAETPSVPSLATGVTREPIRIHTFANLSSTHSSNDVMQACREAWVAMRLLKSPDIATTHQEGKKLYKVAATSEELQAWQKRTFLVAKAGTKIEKIVQDMQLRHEPLPVIYMIPESNSASTFKGTLLFLISHWMTEASGAFMIVNQLIDYASKFLKKDSMLRAAVTQHIVGSEVRLLTLPMEDMFMPMTPRSDIDSEQRIKAYFDDFNSHQPPLEFAMKAGSQLNSPPSHMMQNQRTYTASSTLALVAACKKKGTSVASAIHSAYLAALWELSAVEDRNRPWSCLMPAQMRSRSPDSYSAYREQGCWNSARMLFLSTPSGQDFITRALHLRKQYALADDKVWQYDDLYEMNKQTMNHFVETANQSYSMPYITQIGLLDKGTIASDHGGLTIEGVSVWADALSKGVVLGQWTFRGCLNIQMTWNMAFHESHQVQQTMDRIDKVLIQELGIDLQVDHTTELTF